MIKILESDDQLIVEAGIGDLAPRHESQLAYWGFKADNEGRRFVKNENNKIEILKKITRYLERCDVPIELEPTVKQYLDQNNLIQEEFLESRKRGEDYKEGSIKGSDASEFLSFLNKRIPRKLKDHQIKSALHLLTVVNGANFSVPGSGKTTVVLTVFQFLRDKGLVDSLFVVGPPASFAPWRDEYKEVLGSEPVYEILAGGDIEDRHSKYLTNVNSVCDLYLISFQTLYSDWDQVKVLFSRQGIRFYLVIDEAHYIKQLDGSWASAALEVAKYAERRCILTGTPFPKGYSDAFNLFDVLWPQTPPISTEDKSAIVYFSKKKELNKASELLKGSIAPLFYRVRKSDLGLAPQIFNEPVMVQMNEHEETVYNAILDKLRHASQDDYFRDLDLILRLRRGRMIRLRQCLSYTKLLTTAIEGYDEELYEDDKSLTKIICDYDEMEKPGKLEKLIEIIDEFQRKGEKVVIWSNFIKTLEMIKNTFDNAGYGVHLIYGATPLEKSINISDEITRERAIREFKSLNSGINILVANPAACAESISLHKTCSVAIYYDLSYNCAQYLQSLDRIHRVGGSEDKPSYYYFLQYENTIDIDVLNNVQSKAIRMSQIIDQDYPIYSLDMFEDDDELAAYERLF